MYSHQDLAKNPIRLFRLPNTLAGDGGVTLIVQSIVTWLVEVAIVTLDLRTGAVQSIGFVPEPTSKLARWWFMLDEKEWPTDTKKQLFVKWFVWLFNQVLRGFLIAVICFPFFWPAAVGILTAVGTKEGNDWYFDRTWAPQVYKLIYAGVLGLISTPPMAAYWLLRYGWIANGRLRAEEEAERAAAEEQGDLTNTEAAPATGALDDEASRAVSRRESTPSEETAVPSDQATPSEDSDKDKGKQLAPGAERDAALPAVSEADAELRKDALKKETDPN